MTLWRSRCEKLAAAGRRDEGKVEEGGNKKRISVKDRSVCGVQAGEGG